MVRFSIRAAPHMLPQSFRKGDINMANKTPEQIADEERVALEEAEAKQTAEERVRQEFERGPNGEANRNNEDLARMAAIGTDKGPGGPPSSEPPAKMAVLERPAPSSDNIMYVMPLNHTQVSAGPPIKPHPTNVVIDNMGVRLPPLPTEVDNTLVFLVNGKYVDSYGVPYDQVKVKPAMERIAEKDATIEDLQRQIAELRGGNSNNQ